MFNFLPDNLKFNMPSVVKKHTEVNRSVHVYPNLRPLSKDTVSFSGLDSNKKVTDKAYYGGIGPLARKILADAEEPRLNFERTMKKIFAPYCYFDRNHPQKAIGELVFNKKSEKSMREKFASRQILTEAEAKHEIRDIIRARIIIDETKDNKGANQITNALTKAVKNKQLKIVNIKSYYDMDREFTDGINLECIPLKSLLKLDKEITNIYGESKLKSGTSRDNGYNAVHIIFELENGFYAELQILGRNVEKVKEIEDIIYKIKSNKVVDEKYSAIQEAYDKYIKDKPKREKELEQYTRKVYDAERMKELGKYRGTEGTEFLPLPKDSKLPQIFDFNNLAYLYRK